MKIQNPDRVFFTSDNHFGHHVQVVRRGFVPGLTIDAYLNRGPDVNKRDLVPDELVQNHDVAMANRINDIVKPGDTLFCLGDFSMHGRSAQIAAWRAMIDCETVHLLNGNHDDHKSLIDVGFASVRSMRSVSHRANKVSTRMELCHYPISSWKDMHKGTIHLHGHSHGSHAAQNVGIKRFDVGIDATEIDEALGLQSPDLINGPWSFTQIADAAKTRTNFPNVDHHVPGGCD